MEMMALLRFPRFSGAKILRLHDTLFCQTTGMGTPQIAVPLHDADALAQKLLAVGNTLKPIDETDHNCYFFEVVRELVDAALKNFNELRRGYTTGNQYLSAWASRNLLELLVFTK